MWSLYSIFYVFFFKQKTAYEMRISDWSSDVCSSDLLSIRLTTDANAQSEVQYSINQTPTTVQSAFGIWNASLGLLGGDHWEFNFVVKNITDKSYSTNLGTFGQGVVRFVPRDDRRYVGANRSEAHTSELQSLMRISYAAFCLKKKKKTIANQ